MQIFHFIKDHWIDILAVIGAVDTILGIITKWTPTTWDDNVYAIIHNFFSNLMKKKNA